MKIDNLQNNIAYKSLTKSQMLSWRKLNKIPEYVNASYAGYTGVKATSFPVTNSYRYSRPDITNDLIAFEEKVLQKLKDTRKKAFGYLRALWMIGQNMGTGSAWDTKFLPEFPGRDRKGRKQYAVYKNNVVSGNDVSNIFYGHICAYMGFSPKLAQTLAKMDACGVFDLLTKGHLPDKKLLKFRDTESDQQAIKIGVEEFKLSDYRLI